MSKYRMILTKLVAASLFVFLIGNVRAQDIFVGVSGGAGIGLFGGSLISDFTAFGGGIQGGANFDGLGVRVSTNLIATIQKPGAFWEGGTGLVASFDVLGRFRVAEEPDEVYAYIGGGPDLIIVFGQASTVFPIAHFTAGAEYLTQQFGVFAEVQTPVVPLLILGRVGVNYHF